MPQFWASASIAANLRELLPLLRPSAGTHADVMWSLSLPFISNVLTRTDDPSLEEGPSLVLQTLSSACKAHSSVPEVRGVVEGVVYWVIL